MTALEAVLKQHLTQVIQIADKILRELNIPFTYTQIEDALGDDYINAAGQEIWDAYRQGWHTEHIACFAIGKALSAMGHRRQQDGRIDIANQFAYWVTLVLQRPFSTTPEEDAAELAQRLRDIEEAKRKDQAANNAARQKAHAEAVTRASEKFTPADKPTPAAQVDPAVIKIGRRILFAVLIALLGRYFGAVGGLVGALLFIGADRLIKQLFESPSLPPPIAPPPPPKTKVKPKVKRQSERAITLD
jgi:hypothetical protein